MKKQTPVCGLDVHKDSIYAALFNGKDRSDVQVFGTFTSPVKELINWLHQHKVRRIALESTGSYWVPIWNLLEEAGFELTLVNPWFIKQMPGRKSDVKDAQWIATLLYKDMLRKSFVPPRQIRTLRNYSRQYENSSGKQPVCCMNWSNNWKCATFALPVVLVTLTV
jgi:transposase